MRALSIRQPWAHAIMHFGKRVENRVWKSAPRFMIGQTFLIHASAGCTAEEFWCAGECMRDIYQRSPWPGSTIIPALKELPRGALVARARLADARWGVVDPWAEPTCLHLVLADVEPLPAPIPFKGALGFFDVPDDVLEVP